MSNEEGKSIKLTRTRVFTKLGENSLTVPRSGTHCNKYRKRRQLHRQNLCISRDADSKNKRLTKSHCRDHFFLWVRLVLFSIVFLDVNGTLKRLQQKPLVCNGSKFLSQQILASPPTGKPPRKKLHFESRTSFELAHTWPEKWCKSFPFPRTNSRTGWNQVDIFLISKLVFYQNSVEGTQGFLICTNKVTSRFSRIRMRWQEVLLVEISSCDRFPLCGSSDVHCLAQHRPRPPNVAWRNQCHVPPTWGICLMERSVWSRCTVALDSLHFFASLMRVIKASLRRLIFPINCRGKLVKGWRSHEHHFSWLDKFLIVWTRLFSGTQCSVTTSSRIIRAHFDFIAVLRAIGKEQTILFADVIWRRAKNIGCVWLDALNSENWMDVFGGGEFMPLTGNQCWAVCLAVFLMPLTYNGHCTVFGQNTSVFAHAKNLKHDCHFCVNCKVLSPVLRCLNFLPSFWKVKILTDLNLRNKIGNLSMSQWTDIHTQNCRKRHCG